MRLKEEQRIIKKNTVFTMVVNVFLALMKIIAGIFGKSSVLITDAINSIGDVLTNVVVYISAIFSRKEKDKNHPYGHEKIDSIISIFLGIAIIYTAFEVGRNAIINLYDYFINDIDIAFPAWYALVAAILTIGIKELLFRKTIKDAKKAKSSSLNAQAWDHRSDTIASFGATIGILGAMFGLGFLDPIASIVIACFILRLGLKIILTGINQVIDKAAGLEINNQISEIIQTYDDIKRIDEIKTRQFGLKIYVDLEVSMGYSMTLEESHRIAEKLHDEIEKAIPDVIHCMIHVNPFHENQ